MIINGDDGYSLLAAYIGGPAAQAGWLGPKVGGHLAPFLYSSLCELSELSQWLCHDDSTRNIVVVIIIIIIIIIIITVDWWIVFTVDLTLTGHWEYASGYRHCYQCDNFTRLDSKKSQ